MKRASRPHKVPLSHTRSRPRSLTCFTGANSTIRGRGQPVLKDQHRRHRCLWSWLFRKAFFWWDDVFATNVISPNTCKEWNKGTWNQNCECVLMPCIFYRDAIPSTAGTAEVLDWVLQCSQHIKTLKLTAAFDISFEDQYFCDRREREKKEAFLVSTLTAS